MSQPDLAAWLDKLAIRELLERYMRYNDDGDLGRYRDEVRRASEGGWQIFTRTGVSVARPGEEHTDSEWKKALDGATAEERANLRI